MMLGIDFNAKATGSLTDRPDTLDGMWDVRNVVVVLGLPVPLHVSVAVAGGPRNLGRYELDPAKNLKHNLHLLPERYRGHEFYGTETMFLPI